MKIIIDSRMRPFEKEYLSRYGTLIEVPYHSFLYDEISSHPDILFSKINNQIFTPSNTQVDTTKINNITQTNSTLSSNYPNDIKFNTCQIGNNIIHNFKYTDPKILSYIEEKKLNKINVKQGYTNCSISVTSNNSCITQDKGIYKTLKKQNIDCMLIENETITMLDKNSKKTNMNGFIGGATALINDDFILFGDIDKLKDKEEILKHISKYNLNLVDFKNQEIIDYGGIIII